MRESLGKLKAAVEQEKWLNTSIKEKKVGYYYYYYRLLRTKQHMNNYTMEISGTIATLK